MNIFDFAPPWCVFERNSTSRRLVCVAPGPGGIRSDGYCPGCGTSISDRALENLEWDLYEMVVKGPPNPVLTGLVRLKLLEVDVPAPR